jgi:hypothetical protein
MEERPFLVQWTNRITVRIGRPALKWGKRLKDIFLIMGESIEWHRQTTGVGRWIIVTAKMLFRVPRKFWGAVNRNIPRKILLFLLGEGFENTIHLGKVRKEIIDMNSISKPKKKQKQKLTKFRSLGLVQKKKKSDANNHPRHVSPRFSALGGPANSHIWPNRPWMPMAKTTKDRYWRV